MPIIWRYLLGQYLKVLLFCVVAFIAILLTTRLDEIAHFASLGSEGIYILWFTLYQIPYILPIAVPISCLISSLLLIQRLSQTHELTALRASGMAIRHILAPILLAASFVSLINFYNVSEVATNSHLTTSLLKSELRSINPLLLLHNKHLMRMKGVFFDTMGRSHTGEFAEDIVLAMPNKNNSRINVMIAKNLKATPSTFIGHGVTLISSLSSDTREHHDHLMIENLKEATTAIEDFSQLLQKKVWTVNNDHLQLPLLLIRLSDERQALGSARKANLPQSELKRIQRCINRCYSEIARRVSVGLSAFTFTLMGAAFGISISRNRSNRSIFFVIGLAALYLVAYFAGKGIDHLLIASMLLYFVPQMVIIAISIWTLNRTSKGIE